MELLQMVLQLAERVVVLEQQLNEVVAYLEDCEDQLVEVEYIPEEEGV